MSDSIVCEPVEQQVATVANPDLVAWVADRHAEDFCPAQIFNVMRASGWACDDASAALLEVLPPESHEQVSVLSLGAPDPDLGPASTRVTPDGQAVQVLCDMRNPRVTVFGNLLSSAECEELIEGARSRLARSTVTGDGSDSDESDVRTSSGMFFGRGETALCQGLDARLAALLDWPAEYAEDWQVLRYDKDQQYVPHHDYFEPDSGWAPVFRRGGQRVASVVIYLNTPAAGGATVFPDIPMEVRAIAGNAVFFAYDKADPSSRTLHGGAPVVDGEKWVAVKWLRQGPFG